MKWTKSYLFTMKENPSDAEIPSHQLMIRGGYMRKVAPGIFTYGPLLLRSVRKFEAIVREELTREGCIEILMPMVQPKELWEETGRWTGMGAGLQKLKNRNDHEFCLGATHEEVVTDYVRKDVKSYRDLPFNLFQIQTKFRDEVRPRFGLMRGREFVMKDAYSFDATKEGAQKSYASMYRAYNRIFERLGVDYRVVQADSGNIGGNQSQEFHLLASSGEDELMVSDQSDFAANVEACGTLPSTRVASTDLKSAEVFETKGIKTIQALAKFIGIKDRELVKTMFFSGLEETPSNNAQTDIKPVCVILRGSDEVNPIKLKNLLGLSDSPRLLTEQEVLKLTGAHPGSCGPVGLTIPIYADHGLLGYTNMVVGANKDDYHVRNVNFDKDFKVTQFVDLRTAKAGDLSPDGKGNLKSFRGIEVGHIFYLGTKYSKAMNAQFLSEQGELQPIEMGCYGVGITRVVQAVIEQCHDKDGIIWPRSLAPFDLHICLLDPDNSEAKKISDDVESALQDKGFSVFIDDRVERPGVKFKDADLLGMPFRLNIGARGLEQGNLELVNRKTKENVNIAKTNAVQEILNCLQA